MKQSRREEFHSSGRAAFGAPLRHHSGRTRAAALPLKRRLSFTDSLDRVTAGIANPDYQSTIAYAYDDANRLTGIGQAAGTGNAQPAAPQNVSLGYDEADRRTSLVLPNGIRIAYTWDEANQLTGIGYRTDTGTVIGDLSYGYDAAGQRIRQGGSLAAQDLPATEAGASYDANNRLTDWNGQSIAYDANGNLTADGVSRYTWNSRNQLVAITGATSASFAYDGLGRRRTRTVNGTAMQYLYDGLNAIQEQTGGAASANLLSGLGLDEWYGRTEAGTSLAYVPDALGSVLALADANQTLATRYTYEPYGTTTASGATSANSLAYTGRENDGTGLYYYRARYYHAGIGRFVSEDPIGLAGGYNLAAYARGSPIAYKDPLGLETSVGDMVGPDNKDSPPPPDYPTTDRRPVPPPPPPPLTANADPWPGPDDWRGQCIRLYAQCVNQDWSGNCSSCLNKCTAQQEWPFSGAGSCKPRKCPRSKL